MTDATTSRSGQPAARGHRASEANGRSLPAAGGILLAGVGDTGGNFTLIRTTAPAGDAVPLHRHAAVDESFYILRGSLTVTCGDEVFEAAAGDLVHLPRGLPHRYVAGDDGGEMLILGTPGGLEEFIDDWESGMDVDELARKHRIEFLQ